MLEVLQFFLNKINKERQILIPNLREAFKIDKLRTKITPNCRGGYVLTRKFSVFLWARFVHKPLQHL